MGHETKNRKMRVGASQQPDAHTRNLPYPRLQSFHEQLQDVPAMFQEGTHSVQECISQTMLRYPEGKKLTSYMALA